MAKHFAGPLTLGLLAVSGNAFCHAHLLSSAPPANHVVAKAPESVSLSFTEALEPRFSSVIVTNAAGARMDGNDLSAAPGDPKTVRETLNTAGKSAGPGTYTVRWRAMSVDTHRTQGVFTFTVRP